MSKKLPDSEWAPRVRASNKQRSTALRERLAVHGQMAVTVWIPTELREAVVGIANEDNVTLACAFARLLEVVLFAQAPPSP